MPHQADTIYQQLQTKSGAYKDIADPMREREQALKLADGRVYSGKKAKEFGLIDEFGSLQDATKFIGEKLGLADGKVVRYGQKVLCWLC
ncbi:hypothetical protein BC351_20230 [Paenibacillus ferrarius]|uniref:Peptidase S49 domain-containing protein n=1 Tax=Paenibacillus ferrarius TaxID=1469647 RepID=A0A1V4HNG8_9BACL|nr:S49 family peptidase [Paenibacillus ferrarius]OPH59248.1 hypothetical protein BC351_20230 [Paenibacillus ferrarius]